MTIELSANGHPLSFSDHAPAGDRYELLYRSRGLYASGTYGSLFIQRLTALDFKAVYTQVRASSPLVLQVRCSQPLFALYIGFGQTIPICFVKEETHPLNAHSAALFYAPFLSVSAFFQPLPSTQFLLLIYPLPFVLQQLAFYPLLETIRQKLVRSQSFFTANAIYPLPAALSHLIYQLVRVPTSPNIPADLLMKVLADVFQRMSDPRPPEPLFSLTDVEGVIAARQWIDTHLDKHYTISQIAQRAGINEYLLKAGFKQIYGTGLYGYLLNQRLLLARLQLEGSRKSIRQISRLAGYRSATNFSTAFRRMYGMSPGQWRKKT